MYCIQFLIPWQNWKLILSLCNRRSNFQVSVRSGQLTFSTTLLLAVMMHKYKLRTWALHMGNLLLDYGTGSTHISMLFSLRGQICSVYPLYLSPLCALSILGQRINHPPETPWLSPWSHSCHPHKGTWLTGDQHHWRKSKTFLTTVSEWCTFGDGGYIKLFKILHMCM